MAAPPRRRTFSSMRCLILALTLVTGCAPAVRMVQPARAAVLPTRAFAVEPIRFAGMQVGRVAAADWLERKSDLQRAHFAADTRQMSALFADHVAAAVDASGGPGSLIVRPIVTDLEPGFYAYVYSRKTRLAMRVQILDEEGRLVEEVALAEALPAHAWTAASGPRLQAAAARLGDKLGAFLRRTSR